MTLKQGSKGNEVKQLQLALNINPADGIFGAATEAAVKKFQLSHGLYPDGIVGDKTMKKITELCLDTDLSSKQTSSSNKLIIENHFLPQAEYYNGKYKNEYIILHHTAGWDKPSQVIDSWAKDSLGKVATEFVIGGQRCTDGRNTYDGKVLRAFPQGNQAAHIGKSGSSYMNMHSVGIEMCNFGGVKNGKTYTGANVLPCQMYTLGESFRGYTQFHRYSDKQLKSCHELLQYIANRDNIDLHKGLYEWIKKLGPVKAFEYQQLAYEGKTKGLLTHANIRKDKSDCHPQPELIDMILSL